MKRSELEQHLGKSVTITLFDNEVIEGVLHKTGEEQFKYDPNLSIPKNYYFLLPQSVLFKCSHVKKLTQDNRAEDGAKTQSRKHYEQKEGAECTET